MADEIKSPDDRTAGSAPAVASAVENLSARTDGQPPANVPAGESAGELAAKYGGRPTGRGRADGLTPGSPEAAQKDRERDAERKREQRAARSKLLGKNPKPLPSAIPSSDTVAPLAGDPAALLHAANAALVLWAGTDLEDVVRELIAALQSWRDYAREKKLTLARLDPLVVAELLKDAAWSERLIKIIYESGSRVLAKLLNKTGVSAEKKDEIICASACIAVAAGELRFNSKMAKIIALQTPLAKAA